jgi:hypothetical protein
MSTTSEGYSSVARFGQAVSEVHKPMKIAYNFLVVIGLLMFSLACYHSRGFPRRCREAGAGQLPTMTARVLMTLELQIALKRHTQWFGSYKTSGELKKYRCRSKKWCISNRWTNDGFDLGQKIVRTMP